MIDYIFGQDDKSYKNNKQRELKTQIILKQPKINNSAIIKQPKNDIMLNSNQINRKVSINENDKYDKYQKQSAFSINYQIPQSINKPIILQQKLVYKIPLGKLLQSQLVSSQKGLKFLQKKFINDKLSDLQNLVYNAEGSQQPSNYLQGVYKNIDPENQFIKYNVDSTINNAVQTLQQEINHPNNKGIKQVSKKRVPKTKDDLKQLEKLDKYRMIKIKQGQVKNKVTDLRSQLQKNYFLNKDKLKFDISDIIDTNYYSLEHPQTKKAQNLIKNLKNKRAQQKMRYQSYLSSKQQKKSQSLLMQQKYQTMLKQQRKHQLKQQAQLRFQERQMQKKLLLQKQSQFNQWIRLYKREKPLQQQLQQQMVMKLIIPQIQDRHKKLLKIKEQRKPIDIQDINSHDQRYMDYKRDQNVRQSAHHQMKLEQDHIHDQQSKRHYKGKYRYMALKSMYQQKDQINPRDVERSKKERQIAYSDQVKYYHKPPVRKSNNDAMEDTRSLIRRVRNSNGTLSVNQRRDGKVQNQLFSQLSGRESQTLDARSDGLQNLKFVKNRLKQKLALGEQKKPHMRLIQVRQNNSYIQQQREKRLNSNINPIIQVSPTIKQKYTIHDLSTSYDLDNIRVKVNHLDERLKRKELHNKYSMKDRHTQEQLKFQDDYIQAINTKMRLVQQIN